MRKEDERLLTKEEKKVLVKDLSRQFSASTLVLLTDFRGLSVLEMRDVRKKLQDVNAKFRVVKNTLLRLALKNAGIDKTITERIDLPTAVAYTADDPIKVMKVIVDSEKKLEKPKVKYGILEGQFVDADKVKEYAKLPSKEVILAQIVGSISAPLYGLVKVLTDILRKPVYVLNAIKENKVEQK